MKETEFRARLFKEKSNNTVYIIEKRVNGWFSKWEEVSRSDKIGNATAETELKYYMEVYLNVEPVNKKNIAYATIKRI